MNSRIGNKETKCVWKSITSFFMAVLLITSVFVAITPVSASPNQIWASDSGGMWKDVFGTNEAVYATGDIDPTPDDWMGIPVADLYVVDHAPNWNETLIDVSGHPPPAPNTITSWMIGGQFIGETVWLPTLKIGTYYLVIDENQNGIFDNAGSVYDTYSSAFQVIPSSAPPTINVTEIKGSAKNLSDSWNKTATQWHWMSTEASAIALAWDICWGDWISAAVGVFGIVTGIPTSYNDAVLTVGGSVIENISRVQAAHYNSLHADPPDSNFTEFATIDVEAINNEVGIDLPSVGISYTYPFATLGNTSYEAAQVGVMNNLTLQAAIVSALQSSIEKYQGAKDANDYYYIYLQAKAVKKYSDMLLDNLNSSKQALENYKIEQINSGRGYYVYNVSEIKAIQQRLMSTGLTPDEIADLKSVGFNDASIAAMINKVVNATVPSEDFTMVGTTEDVVAAINNSMLAFQNLSAQAQAVMDDIGPYIENHHPVAMPGGPYTGNEGSPIIFNGSGSYDPDGDALTYEWDFDLDGDFDDASGVTVTWTWNSEFSGTIGLKVNDTTGLSDIAYTSVTVSSVNEPPIIDSFSPAELRPTASHLNPLTFTVTAHDPDGDILSYNWTLDGVEVSTNNSWIYTPDATESGLKVVKVTISDGSPLSRDTIETRIVSVSSINISLASPFLVSGYVYYENGSECNNPGISITNLNTSKEWVAETKEGSNYYQLILASGADVNASEILRFNATSPDGKQSNITVHTVTLEEINDGGLFGFNISLAAPVLKTYTISLAKGWNLISVPLNLTTWELGEEAVVGDPLNVTPKNSLTSIYRYNTTSGLFEKCDHFDNWGWWPATGSESFTKLEPGRGYWVMAKNDCNLTFTGTAPSDLNVTVKKGWNLIGWYSMEEALLGEESVVGDPLNVTPKNSLTSIYRYNATSGLFEKCDHFDNWGWWPATSSESFTKLEPGRGYWVMAKNDCVWRHEA